LLPNRRGKTTKKKGKINGRDGGNWNSVRGKGTRRGGKTGVNVEVGGWD